MNPDSGAEKKPAIFTTPFEGFFRQHDAIMIFLDETGNIIDANDTAIAFYGYSLLQMKKMNIRDINQLSSDELKASLHQIDDQCEQTL